MKDNYRVSFMSGPINFDVILIYRLVYDKGVIYHTTRDCVRLLKHHWNNRYDIVRYIVSIFFFDEEYNVSKNFYLSVNNL